MRRRHHILAIAAVLSLGSSAFAQNWINPAGGSWGTASNWQGDALPTMPNFGLGSTSGYTVTLDKTYNVPSVSVQSDTVTIGLNGYTLASAELTIDGSLTLLGPGEYFATNYASGTTGEVSGGQLIVNGATLDEGAGEEAGAGFNVNGLMVENGGAVNLQVPGNYSVSNGTLNDGSLSVEQGINLSLDQMNLSNGSSIGNMFNISLGSATIDDSHIGTGNSMTVGGTVTLQNSASLTSIVETVSGTLNILPTAHAFGVGELTMTSTGTIVVELNALVDNPTGRPWAGSNGTLDITLQPGFEPTFGEQFNVLNPQTPATGTYATLDLPALPGGESWDTSDLYTTGAITVVPEPATIGLITISIASLGLRRRAKPPIT